MLSSTRTPAQKRQDLRSLLVPGAAAPFPGAFTPLSAKLKSLVCAGAPFPHRTPI